MQYFGNGWRFFVASSRVTFLLIAANIAVYVWLVQDISGSRLPSEVLIRHGAMGSFVLPLGEYWRLVTYGFLHVDALHLATNVLCLLLWGPYLEKRVGALYFVLIYLGALVGAALVTNFAHATPYITVGASGAIAGILGALLCLSILGKIDLSAQFFIANIGFNVVTAFAVPNVDWRAHAGGFAAGLVCCALLNAMGGVWRAFLRCKFPEFIKLNGAIVLAALLCWLWIAGMLHPAVQGSLWLWSACVVVIVLAAIKIADWLLCRPKGLVVFVLLFAVANGAIALVATMEFQSSIALQCRAWSNTGAGIIARGIALLCADLAVTMQAVSVTVCTVTLLLYVRELRKGLADVGFVANGLQAQRRRIAGI